MQYNIFFSLVEFHKNRSYKRRQVISDVPLQNKTFDCGIPVHVIMDVEKIFKVCNNHEYTKI